jgi:RNA polymerase sigma-70 factor, ECF subfamily
MSLPPNYRHVYLLRDVEEFDTREVADVLKISIGTVKVRLHRARMMLRKRLGPLLQSPRSLITSNAAFENTGDRK